MSGHLTETQYERVERAIQEWYLFTGSLIDSRDKLSKCVIYLHDTLGIEYEEIQLTAGYQGGKLLCTDEMLQNLVNGLVGRIKPYKADEMMLRFNRAICPDVAVIGAYAEAAVEDSDEAVDDSNDDYDDDSDDSIQFMSGAEDSDDDTNAILAAIGEEDNDEDDAEQMAIALDMRAMRHRHQKIRYEEGLATYQREIAEITTEYDMTFTAAKPKFDAINAEVNAARRKYEVATAQAKLKYDEVAALYSDAINLD